MAKRKRSQQGLKALGDAIRRKREAAFLTQEALAVKIGVEPQTITRWENGKNFPGNKERQKLRKVLHLSEDVFLLSQEEPERATEERHEQGADMGKPRETYLLLPIPPAPVRRYAGKRTGTFDRPELGEQPRYDYDKENLGAGQTYVTVNGYPLDFAYKDETMPFSTDFDWGYIGERTHNLAVSLLANYFGETLPARQKKMQEGYYSLRYAFSFYADVVIYLPFEEWEITSNDIRDWLAREDVRTTLEAERMKNIKEEKDAG